MLPESFSLSSELSSFSEKFSLSFGCFRQVLFFPSLLPFRKPFFWKPYFSVLTSLSQMLPISSLSSELFFLFRKPFFRMFPEPSLSFRNLPDPSSLFLLLFSLSWFDFPFHSLWDFWTFGAFKAGHFLWRDEQVKRERGGERALKKSPT